MQALYPEMILLIDHEAYLLRRVNRHATRTGSVGVLPTYQLSLNQKLPI
jgi:hypothetical protein